MEYFNLLKRAFTNAFKSAEYRRWWAVPLGQRFVFGLVAGATTWVLIMLLIAGSANAIAWIIYGAFVLLVEVPIAEYYSEKLKQKYDHRS